MALCEFFPVVARAPPARRVGNGGAPIPRGSGVGNGGASIPRGNGVGNAGGQIPPAKQAPQPHPEIAGPARLNLT